MRTKSKIIGTGQLFCLLVLSRILYSMLYHTEDFASGTPLMWAQLIATGAELILAIPMLLFITKGREIGEAISDKRWVQMGIRGLYSIYFILLLANMLADFAVFMAQSFDRIGSPWVIALVLSGAVGYISALGIQGIGRAAGVVFWIVLLFVGSMALLSEGEMHLEYLTPMKSDEMPYALAYGLEELSSNWWLPMAVCLAEHIKSDSWKAGLGYLLFKLAFVEGLIFLVTVILWRYMNVAEYPILALGSYARTDFIQQFDGVNLFVWTLNACVVGGGFCFSASKIGRGRLWAYGTAALSFGLAVAVLYGVIPFPDTLIRLIGAVALGSILPLVALISGRLRAR